MDNSHECADDHRCRARRERQTSGFLVGLRLMSTAGIGDSTTNEHRAPRMQDQRRASLRFDCNQRESHWCRRSVIWLMGAAKPGEPNDRGPAPAGAPTPRWRMWLLPAGRVRRTHQQYAEGRRYRTLDSPLRWNASLIGGALCASVATACRPTRFGVASMTGLGRSRPSRTHPP